MVPRNRLWPWNNRIFSPTRQQLLQYCLAHCKEQSTIHQRTQIDDRYKCLLREFLATAILSLKGMFGRVYRYPGFFSWAYRTYRSVGYRYLKNTELTDFGRVAVSRPYRTNTGAPGIVVEGMPVPGVVCCCSCSHINSLTKESVVTRRCWSPRKIRKTTTKKSKFGCLKHETKKAHTR